MSNTRVAITGWYLATTGFTFAVNYGFFLDFLRFLFFAFSHHAPGNPDVALSSFGVSNLFCSLWNCSNKSVDLYRAWIHYTPFVGVAWGLIPSRFLAMSLIRLRRSVFLISLAGIPSLVEYFVSRQFAYDQHNTGLAVWALFEYVSLLQRLFWFTGTIILLAHIPLSD